MTDTFTIINRSALDSGYLTQLYPHGRQVGRELQVGNVQGDPGRSMCVNLNTGSWIDNATGERGGDMVSLVAVRENVQQLEAAKIIWRDLGFDWPPDPTPRRSKTWKKAAATEAPKPFDFQPLPAPVGSVPDFRLGGRAPDLISEYRHADGRLAFYTLRFEARSEKQRKSILPLSYGEFGGQVGWHRKMPPGGNRPLLGLYRLIEGAGRLGGFDGKPGLIVEGEKTYEAAMRLVGERYHVFTWAGGCQAIEFTDWRVLDGMKLYIWPDNDAAGLKAARRIAQILKEYPAAEVFMVEPPAGMIQGWDLADAEKEGWLP